MVRKTAKNKGIKTKKGVAIQEKEEERGREKEKGGRKRERHFDQKTQRDTNTYADERCNGQGRQGSRLKKDESQPCLQDATL